MKRPCVVCSIWDYLGFPCLNRLVYSGAAPNHSAGPGGSKFRSEFDDRGLSGKLWGPLRATGACKCVGG